MCGATNVPVNINRNLPDQHAVKNSQNRIIDVQHIPSEFGAAISSEADALKQAHTGSADANV
jgi:hypothetical protein